MMEAEERMVADRMEGVPLPAACQRVLGHDDALNQLISAYRSGRMHHGWLIAGAKGIGKSSLAFNMAKHIFSHPDPSQAPAHFDPATFSPATIAQVENGAHPNLMHMMRPWDSKAKKFKTQLTVGEVRELQKFFGLTAGMGGWRICIVDAADDLNTNSANALLKMLEEPPKRTILFVITHVIGRLLPTIRSRCQVLHLGPLPDDTITEITSSFDLGVQQNTLASAAKLADGSVRKTVQLVQGGVLEVYATFDGMMNARATGTAGEWLMAHRIAEQLAPSAKDEAFKLFMDLAMAWIGRQVRALSHMHPSALAGWAEVWEKTTRSLTLCEAFNLDRKQVVLNLFADLFEQHKS